MSIFEYDEEKHMKSEREFWFQNGLDEGLAQGEKRLAELLQMLMGAGRLEEAERALSDTAFREELYRENGLI